MSEEWIDDPFKVEVLYRYFFSDGRKVEFDVTADLSSPNATCYTEKKYSWAKLSVCRCEFCSLKSTENPYCPAALSILDIIEYFKEEVSYSNCRCEVVLPEKTVIAEKSLQDALYPLIGLRMATSSCPVLSKFKPMARFHEPFSSPFYTVYRSISFYLLSQYFEGENGVSGSFDLSGLKEFYCKINEINQKMASRLKEAEVNDATPNSILILSLFGSSMTYLFEEYLKVLRKLFQKS